MKQFNFVVRMLVLAGMLFGLVVTVPAQPVFALEALSNDGAGTKGISPEDYLNPDGTLNLDENFSGTFDIDGWNVQLDPLSGPVFTPAAAEDNWDTVGTGSGPFNDVVNAVAVDGTDVYVGGWFRNVDGIAEADGIAKWDGSQWVALSSNGSGNGALTGAVNALEFFNGFLYIGGTFVARNTSNTTIAQYLAKWDGSVWSSVGGVSISSGWVYELEVYDGPVNDILYVGGAFTDLNGIAEADKIAMYNITTNTWSNMGDNGAGVGSITGNVYALDVDQATGEVYVGGAFNDADGLAAADRIVKWDGSNWSAMGSSAVNGTVLDILVVDSDNVYVGGYFTDVNGIAAADHIAKWNDTTSTWSALGSYSGDGALTVDQVNSMVLNGSTLYVAGMFEMADPALAAGKYLAKYDTGTSTWSIVDDNGAGGSVFGGTEGVSSIAIASGILYVGGYFPSVNDDGTVRNNSANFAGMDLSTDEWSGYGIGNGLLSQPVYAIAAMGTDVYVGGNFGDAGNDPRMDYLVHWDGTTWNPVGTGINGSLNGSVYALTVDGTDLYAGGVFTKTYNNGIEVGGTARIAKWDSVTETWSSLGYGADTASPALNNAVYSITILGDDVYAGGLFM